MEKTRDYHMDNIKALLIFCVVLGHTITHFSTTTECFILYKIIYSFHMPVFVWVTGYFAKYNPKNVMLKVVPLYLFTQTAHYIYDMAENYAFNRETIYVKIQFFTQRYALWFLIGIIIWQLLIPLIDTDSKYKQLIILALSLIISHIISGEDIHGKVLSLTRVINFFPYFILGYYSKDWLKNVSHTRKIPNKIIAAIICIGIIIGMIITNKMFSRQIFFGLLNYGESGYTWELKVLTWILAILWIYVLYILIPKRKLPLISYIGKTTLPIYLIHIFVLRTLKNLVATNTIVIPYIDSSIFATIALALLLTIVLSWSVLAKFFELLNLNKLLR